MTTGTDLRRVAPGRRAWVEQVMGMPVSIHLRGEGSRSASAEARVQAAYDELRAVDVLFSPFRPDSEVSRLARGELAPAAAHPLVGAVVELCEQARVVTDGSFDAWRPTGREARRRFDPTGLVKGWAVQRAADHLAAGLDCDVSINAGGDIALRPGREAAPWRIGIEDPADTTRVLAVLSLAAGGVATSGTARRGDHVVDPATGLPVRSVSSVTVVGPSLTWADVLATAAFVRGLTAVDWLDTVPGYEGLVVTDRGVRVTRGWTGPSQRPHR